MKNLALASACALALGLAGCSTSQTQQFAANAAADAAAIGTVNSALIQLDLDGYRQFREARERARPGRLPDRQRQRQPRLGDRRRSERRRQRQGGADQGGAERRARLRHLRRRRLRSHREFGARRGDQLMAAPVVAAIVAFLSGAGGAVTTAPWAIAVLHGEQVVAGVYADLPTLCAATDPLVDALGDAHPNAIELSRLVVAADAICAAADRRDTPPNQARLVVATIVAMKAAAAKIGAAPSLTRPAIRP